METAQVLDVSREAVIVLLKLAAPLMITALVVGLVISLFQALTQIQEMTLAFVPKNLGNFRLAVVFPAVHGDHPGDLCTRFGRPNYRPRLSAAV